MKNLLSKVFRNVISTVIILYFILAFSVFTPYYNWKYAQTHGLIEWIWFGEIVATAKAIAWPYFVFLSPSSRLSSHVSNAIDYANQATVIINRGEAYQQITQSDINAIIGFYKKALLEAEQTDIETMNRHYPDFGTHFNDEFIQGLKLFIKSQETGNAVLAITSQRLLDQWGKWYSENINGIRGK